MWHRKDVIGTLDNKGKNTDTHITVNTHCCITD